MNTAVINIKINPNTKEKAQQVAQELGFSLSSLVNAYLKQLVKTKTVYFSAAVEEEPTQYLLNALKESKENLETENVSPTFSNAKDAIAWLNNPHKKYQNED